MTDALVENTEEGSPRMVGLAGPSLAIGILGAPLHIDLHHTR